MSEDVTYGEVKKLFKPRLKSLSKNQLIDIVIELSIINTELKKEKGNE